MERLAAILEVGAVQPKRVESYDDLLAFVPKAMELNECLYERIQLINDPEARLVEIQRHHSFAEIIGAHVDSFIHALVARAIEERVRESVWLHLQDERLSQEHLAVISDLLKTSVDMRRIFTEAFRSEYRVFANTIESQFSFGDDQETFDWTRHFSTYGFLFHPNRSRQIFLEEMRQFIHALSQPVFPADGELLLWEDRFYPVGRRVRPNMIGDLLLAITLPSLEGAVSRVFIREAEISAIHVAVALHQYRHETGAWPEDLADFVPEFLETVPVDPFDGEPMRYRKENRVIYSVGLDRVDQEGSRRSVSREGEAKHLRDMEDLVFGF